MSREKELEKTPVKSTEKKAEKNVEKNTEAVAPTIPWASASVATESAPVAEAAVESAVEPAAEVAEIPATTAEKAAKEAAAKEPVTEPDKPARPGFFDRIPGLRSGALWAHLLFILVALYAFDYVTHAAADDIYVYRLGAVSLADGPDGYQLYGFRTRGLPFTYPPFAALLFYPLAFLTEPQSMLLITAIICALSYWCAYLLYSYARSRSWRLPLQKHLGHWGMVSLIAALIWMCGPWRLTTHFGQINAIILALILADFMRPATRVPRGVLLGIAAGIKLTPLAFGLLLLMRKDWKGIATLGASFAATVGIGFLVIREESLTFWFHAVHDTSRVGWFSYFDNVSIMGTLTHAGLQHHLTATALSVVQVALTLLIVLVTAVLLVPLIRARALMAQLALTAFMMLQISPISWSHHNTWYPLMLAAVVMEIFPLMYQRVSSFVFTLAVILATAALVGMYISPFWIVLAFSPHFNSDQILMVPEGSLGLMAGTMPYQLMYLFILVTFFVYLAHRQSVERAARAAGDELAEAKYSR